MNAFPPDYFHVCRKILYNISEQISSLSRKILQPFAKFLQVFLSLRACRHENAGKAQDPDASVGAQEGRKPKVFQALDKPVLPCYT